MIVIQNTWNSEDDQDLLHYINTFNHVCLDEKEIEQIDKPDEYSVIFADTIIVQNVLKNAGIHIDYFSYDKVFEKFYKRKISVSKYQDLKDIQKPYFVKPYYNDKSFDAVVVKDDNDFLVDLLPTDLVYVCEPVDFVNEFRLFVYGRTKCIMVESSSFIIDHEKIKNMTVPKEFISDVLKTNVYNYVIIDIGAIFRNGVYEWVIVEINPPYSLSSYDLPIEVYYNYCIDAWKSITSN